MNDLSTQRDLGIVESEIISLVRQAQQSSLIYIIEIGRRLTEAKSLVPHGEWAEWLEKKVDFKQRTASNFMKIYEEYGTGQLSLFGNSANSQPVANLNYTQLVALLALPGEEREEFIAENDVENMSKRELEKAVKERKEAIERAEAAEEKAKLYEAEKERAAQLEKKAEDVEAQLLNYKGNYKWAADQLEKAKAAEKKAKKKLAELKENPQIPQELIDKANAEAEASASEKAAKELEAKTTELRSQLENAQRAKQAAERAAEQALAKASELEKQVKMSDPNIDNFKRLFDQAQKDVSALFDTIKKIEPENPELAAKFKAAVQAFLKKCEVK